MDYFIAIAPSLGLGVLFYFIMRAFITADRRERAIDAQVRQEIRAKLEREAEESATEM